MKKFWKSTIQRRHDKHGVRVAHAESRFDVSDLSRHQGLREIDLSIPELGQECQAELAGGVLLQNFLQGRG